MSKIPLDKKGIKRIRNLLEKQVTAVQSKLACRAYTFFVNFGYHVDGGHATKGGGGWTMYYISNWRTSINGIDTTVSPSSRRPEYMLYINNVDYGIAEFAVKLLDYGDSFTVTNSVWYGSILNNGGQFENTDVSANRFVEQCVGIIEQQKSEIINSVRKECPDL